MRPSLRPLTIAAVLSLGTLLQAADSPFVGRWALTIPGGGAGWLGVESKDGALSSSVLWGGGSVVPTNGTKIASWPPSKPSPPRSKAKTSSSPPPGKTRKARKSASLRTSPASASPTCHLHLISRR